MHDEFDPLSPEYLSEMFRPSVVLIPGTADDSWKAFRVLEEAQVRFSVEGDDESQVLVVLWSGMPFVGLSAIEDLAQKLSTARLTIREQMNSHFPNRVSERTTQEMWISLRNYQLMTAQAKMEEITKTKKPSSL